MIMKPIFVEHFRKFSVKGDRLSPNFFFFFLEFVLSRMGLVFQGKEFVVTQYCCSCVVSDDACHKALRKV